MSRAWEARAKRGGQILHGVPESPRPDRRSQGVGWWPRAGRSLIVLSMDAAATPRAGARAWIGQQRGPHGNDQSLATGGKPAASTRVRRRWRIRWGRLVATGIAVYLLAGLVAQQVAFWSTERELEALDAQLRQLEARQRLLREERARVDSPLYVDQAARQRLGLVKEGETVIQLVDQGTARSPQQAAPEDPSAAQGR